jgi:PAS domain S-box-containing protein
VLLAAVVLPMAAFGIYGAASFALLEQDRYRREATQIAALVGRVVENNLQSLLSLLRGLSTSSALQNGDLSAFHAEARRLVAGRDRIIVLRDLGTTQLMNTQVDFGEALPPAIPLSAGEIAALRAGEALVADVYASPLSGEPRVAVALPISVGGTFVVLALTVPTSHLRDIIASAAPEGWTVGVADSAGTIVARSERHEDFAGLPGIPEYLEKASGASGAFRSVGLDGVDFLVGYARPPFSNWLFAANVPVRLVEEPLRQSLMAFAGLGLIVMAVVALVAGLFTRRFALATRELASRAASVERVGLTAEPLASGLAEFDQIAEALETARAKQALAEKALRDRSRELEVVLETVPAAVWFTHDPEVRTVLRNRAASELMRVSGENTSSVASGELAHFTVMRNGKVCRPEELPLQRALGGQDVNDDEYTFRYADGSECTVLTSARALRSEDGTPWGAVSVSVDITDRKRGEEQRQLLIHELNHRVKNTLAMVQSVATLSLRNTESREQAEHSLSGRLVAMARAHDVLTNENWEGAEVQEVTTSVLSAVTSPDRLEVVGPRCWLPPSTSLSLALCYHELATNAVKHGALSNATGRVKVAWSVQSEQAQPKLTITWTERGGPAVAPPARRGFGTRLLERLFHQEGGSIGLNYAPEGLECTITIEVRPGAPPPLRAAATERGLHEPR